MNDVLSLQRFVYRFKRGELSGRIRVGGRYMGPTQSAAHFLIDGEHKFEIPMSKIFKTNDLIIVTLEAGDILEPSSQEICTLRAKKILESQLVAHASRAVLDSVAVPDSVAVLDSSESIVRRSNEEIKRWSPFLFQIRSYFHNQGFTEATTPSLVVNPGMEPELEPFATTWRRGSQSVKYFLPTSPELHLKKIMARGFTDLFEIKTVYRNEEKTPLHEPEFTMLEWYRGFADLQMIENDLLGLLNFIGEKAFGQPMAFQTLKKIKVAEILRQKLGFELRPDTTQLELFDLAQAHQLQPSKKLNWNDLFHLIWVAKIDENLPHEPFLLTDYPPSQAALAKINSQGWADRFELYWDGVEIANAFNELTDAHTQRDRFVRDQKLRIEYGRTPIEIDEEFMSALEMGLPPSGGIAVGLDRLFKRFMSHYYEGKSR